MNSKVIQSKYVTQIYKCRSYHAILYFLFHSTFFFAILMEKSELQVLKLNCDLSHTLYGIISAL